MTDVTRWRCLQCTLVLQGPPEWTEPVICTGLSYSAPEHPPVPMQRMYPLDAMPGDWWYWYTSEPDETPVTVAAQNDDEPSALPTVTGSGRTIFEAIEDLQANILAWTL